VALVSATCGDCVIASSCYLGTHHCQERRVWSAVGPLLGSLRMLCLGGFGNKAMQTVGRRSVRVGLYASSE